MGGGRWLIGLDSDQARVWHYWNSNTSLAVSRQTLFWQPLEGGGRWGVGVGGGGVGGGGGFVSIRINSISGFSQTHVYTTFPWPSGGSLGWSRFR